MSCLQKPSLADVVCVSSPAAAAFGDAWAMRVLASCRLFSLFCWFRRRARSVTSEITTALASGVLLSVRLWGVS